jgi:nucleotide-binding universal stress UspA family protein
LCTRCELLVDTKVLTALLLLTTPCCCSKGKLKEMWLGSVTKAMVHKSRVPVAVVP